MTALCGQLVAMKSLFSPSLRGAVLLSYSLRVSTGESLEFSGNEGKKDLAISFPCRDYSQVHRHETHIIPSTCTLLSGSQ